MNASRTTITDVEPLAARWLRLTFGDGAIHEVDLAELLQAGGVLAALGDNDEIFRAVSVDDEFGTIGWPGETDLDPDVLRGDHPLPLAGPYLGESFSRSEHLPPAASGTGAARRTRRWLR